MEKTEIIKERIALFEEIYKQMEGHDSSDIAMVYEQVCKFDIHQRISAERKNGYKKADPNEPATEKQLNYMKKLNIPLEDRYYTKAEASRLIDEKVGKKS